MVSKSSSPHSIRFKNELWAQVVSRAERDKVTPNEAVVALVEAGLKAEKAGELSAKVAAVLARPRKATPPTVETIKLPGGMRVTGIRHVTGSATVPLHKPKAFNPQPKKGRGK